MNVLILTAALMLAQVVGTPFIYTVQPGDTLTNISARYGIDIRVLAEQNALVVSRQLNAGQALLIDNRHIAVASGGATVVVNVPQRMLFLFQNEDVPTAYPIAAGSRGWKTPSADLVVASKEKDPTWDVPVSIQEEMRRAGRPVVKRVPPSPQNPLGEYWIGLSLPGLGIHGTNAPRSIYGLVTHGCIRLHPDDVRSLYHRVEVGTRVRLIYEPVLIARAGDSVFLEAHRDTYGQYPDALKFVMERSSAEGFAHLLDLQLVREVLERRDGIARDVTH